MQAYFNGYFFYQTKSQIKFATTQSSVRFFSSSLESICFPWQTCIFSPKIPVTYKNSYLKQIFSSVYLLSILMTKYSYLADIDLFSRMVGEKK
jgi:hypothetical protein